MKKNKGLLLIGVIIFSMLHIGFAEAVLVSFLEEDNFAGIDTISGFSTTNSMNVLGRSSLSILNGDGELTAYSDGNPGIFTHTGTQGIGIAGGGFDDRIDWVWPWGSPREYVLLALNSEYYLTGLEFRSMGESDYLFAEPDCWFEGIRLPYITNSGYYVPYYALGKDGIIAIDESYVAEHIIPSEYMYDYNQDVRIKGLLLYIPQEPESSFTLARISLKPIPEPMTLTLMGIGLAGMAIVKSGRKQ